MLKIFSMKKVFYVFFALFFSVIVSNAQIPNFSFESWNNMGNYENPDNWGTMNNTSATIGVYTATKGTPGNPGTAFLKLTSNTTPTGVLNGIAVCGVLDTISMQPVSGFPFNARPQSFNGKWQHMIFGNSQGEISVTLTKWNTNLSLRDTVAFINKKLSGMAMSWADFSLNFNYLSGDNPDSCIIFLKASGSIPTNDDYLWVDNLTFEGEAAEIDKNISKTYNISLFPNPATNELIIETDNGDINYTFSIFNVKGQELINQKGNEQQTKIDICNLANGVYYVKGNSNSECIFISTFIKK